MKSQEPRASNGHVSSCPGRGAAAGAGLGVSA